MTELKQIVQNLIKVCSAHDTKLDQYVTKVEDGVNDLCAELAFMWAGGATLNELCEVTKNLFEGNVVRMLRRLTTVLQQIDEATESWTDQQLNQLCKSTILKVNRGIVKADSLYIIEQQD